MKISKLFLALICLMLCLAIAISFSSCEKTNIENEQYFDPDEIGYAAFDNDDDSDGDGLNERGSTFKITSVTSDDSLPIINPQTGKKQKYGRRQIVSTVENTRFYVKGYGFKNRSDSSWVYTTIKNNEIDNFIISWTDTLIVVDVSQLENPLFINNTFSIKFKVQRENDKAGKRSVTRVKSKACISDTKAGFSNCQNIDTLAKLIRRDLAINTPLGGLSDINADYYPTKGDVISLNSTNQTEYIIVLETPDKKDNRYFDVKYIVQKTNCEVSQRTMLAVKNKVGLFSFSYYVTRDGNGEIQYKKYRR